MQGQDERAACPRCGIRIERARGEIVLMRPGNDMQYTINAAEICRKIYEHGGPISRATQEDGTVAYSAEARVSWRDSEAAVWHRGALLGFAETMGPAAPGRISVDADAVSVAVSVSGKGGRRASGRWAHLDVRAVQAASSSLQLSLPRRKLVELRFVADSPRRWETLMQRLIADAWARAGRGRVVEFQPRVVAVGPGAP